MNIEVTTPDEQHNTEAHHIGEWVKFTCPTCGYIRTMNKTTGEMKVISQGDATVLHRGMAYPIGIDPDQSMN